MHEQQIHYSPLLSSIPDILLLISNDGLVIFANPACQSFSGLTETEIIGSPPAKCFPPDFASAVLELAQRVQSGAPDAQAEVDCSQADGLERSFRLRACGVNDSGVLATLITATEITEYRRVRSDLERLNRSLRVLSEADNALIHQRQEESLLQRTCVSLVKTGQHQFAWAGYVTGTGADTMVLPVASFGIRRNAVSRLAAPPPAEIKQSTPTLTAILRRHPVVIHDTRTENGFALPKFAGKRYLSSIDIPILDGKSLLGVLSAYDSMPGRFGRYAAPPKSWPRKTARMLLRAADKAGTRCPG